jgi:SAM-dependent methyltransferase
VLDRPEEYQRMAQAELRHWWYRSLHHRVLRALRRYSVSREARLIDAGCGTGGMLMFLRKRGFENLAGYDVCPHAITIANQRALPVELMDLRELDQVTPPGSADVFISNDTLYFLTAAEQKQFLATCERALKPGGVLILNLPALDAFRGIHDLSVGIERRFSKSEARMLLDAAGFSIVQLDFWPFFLSPFIYLARRSQRSRLQRSPRATIRSDVEVPPFPLNQLLEFITRVENALFSRKPIGSSLFIVARKPHRAAAS